MQRLRCALSAALALLCGACGESAPPPRHLILVTLDTLRADRLGTYGYARELTPHLDALAARGIRFDDAISQAISTPPSHASIFTGLNPPQHGLRKLSGQRLADENVTLAERLREAGFQTAAFVGGLPLRRALGLDQGFEVYDDAFGEAGERPAGETVDRVQAWLPELRGDRLFLWVHFFDPHMPYFPPPEERSRFRLGELRREDLATPVAANQRGRPKARPAPDVLERMTDLYDSEVAYTDAQLGRLLGLLEARGVLRDAVVAVVADHGECLGEHGYFFGHWDVWYATARIPMLLAHPDRRGAGTAVAATVRSIDLMPTLLAWLGVDAPALLEGSDLSPLVEGRERTPRAAYTEQLEYFPARAVSQGEWLLAEHDFAADARALSTPKLYGRDPGVSESPVIAAPAGVEERLAASLQRAIAPAEARPTVGQALEEGVSEALRALGYVVEPAAEPPAPTPARP